MKLRILSFLFTCLVRSVYATLRVTVVGEERIKEECARSGVGVILATWHGRTFVPIVRFGRRGYWAMISTSRDGELQNRIFQRLGFNTVRGSTSARGAIAGALRIARELKNGAVLAHTPDGPRGPRHHLYDGVIFLAQKSGCSIIPAGISHNPRFEIPTWDRYQFPYPFARAALIYGNPITIPKNCSEEERETFRQQISDAINNLEAQAEAMVCSRQSYGSVQPQRPL